jgi:uncharacterized membrane protein
MNANENGIAEPSRSAAYPSAAATTTEPMKGALNMAVVTVIGVAVSVMIRSCQSATSQHGYRAARCLHVARADSISHFFAARPRRT